MIHVVFNCLQSFIKWFADCSHCNQGGLFSTKKTCLISMMWRYLQQTLRVDQTCSWCSRLWCRLLIFQLCVVWMLPIFVTKSKSSSQPHLHTACNQTTTKLISNKASKAKYNNNTVAVQGCPSRSFAQRVRLITFTDADPSRVRPPHHIVARATFTRSWRCQDIH